MSQQLQELREKNRVARFSGPEIHEFIHSSQGDERRGKLRLIAQIRNEFPISVDRLLNDRVRGEEKTRADNRAKNELRKMDVQRTSEGGDGEGSASSTLPKFLRRLRDALRRGVVTHENSEEQLLMAALNRGAGRSRMSGVERTVSTSEQMMIDDDILPLSSSSSNTKNRRISRPHSWCAP